MLRKIKNLTVRRSNWTGRKENRNYPMSPSSLLVNEGSRFDGEMCCLGFLCKAMGVPKKVMTGMPFPAHLRDDFDIEFNSIYPTINAFDIAKVNDDRDLTQAEREEKLIELFAESDIKLTFKD